ncbi:hypothetical protein M8J76_016184 [Diaphorina citri]|nr:hypothetical protein M8J76_016184 [Diaphorina citri]
MEPRYSIQRLTNRANIIKKILADDDDKVIASEEDKACAHRLANNKFYSARVKNSGWTYKKQTFCTHYCTMVGTPLQFCTRRGFVMERLGAFGLLAVDSSTTWAISVCGHGGVH